jgi:hypothetical protein
MLEKHVQDVKRLSVQLQLDSALAQFACRDVDFKGSESQKTGS